MNAEGAVVVVRVRVLGLARAAFVLSGLGRLAALGALLRRYGAELLTAVAFLAAWAFLTAGIAALPHVLPRVVWLVSAGLLCLGLGGARLAYTIARDGLYALTRGGPRG